MSPRLHDGPPVPERRRNPRPEPIEPQPLPHMYRLWFGEVPIDVRGDSVAEAIAVVHDQYDTDVRPIQVIDLTEVAAWFGRRLATANGG